MGKIKDIIFDGDGTLYKTSDELFKAHDNFFLDTILSSQAVTRKQAQVMLTEGAKREGSQTGYLKSLGIGGGNIRTIVQMMEESAWDKTKILLAKDERLKKMLFELKEKGNGIYVLRNGTFGRTKKILNSLLGYYNGPDRGGISVETSTNSRMETESQTVKPFDAIWPTAELGIMKPNIAAFEGLMREHNLIPERTLMVGDRPRVDLFPAKALGMDTAQVHWNETTLSDQEDKRIDYHLQSIYHLPMLLEYIR